MLDTTENTLPAGLRTLSRAVALDHPGWMIRFNIRAIPERRWTADIRKPLTRAEIALGFSGSIHAPTIGLLEYRLTRELFHRVGRLL